MEPRGTTAWRLLAAVLVLMLFITTSDGACDLTEQQGIWWHGNTHSNQVVYVDYFNGNSTIRWRHDLQITETFICLEASTILSNFMYFIIQSVDDPSHKECLQLFTRGSYTFYARKVVSHENANLCVSEMRRNTLNITILHHEPFTDFDTQPFGLAREKFHCSYNDSTTSNQCTADTQSVCTALNDGIVTNTCNTMSDYAQPHHNSLENLISLSGSLVGLSPSLTLSVFTMQINGTTYFYTSKTENRYPEVIIRLFYQKDGYLPIGGDQSSEGITFILTNIDECESGPCHNNATCIDGVNSYTCICPPGWTGLTCQQNIEECLSLPCQNGGTCVDDINRYTCSCPAGWTGGNCETNIDECESLPCQNDGTCIDRVNGFDCSCQQGWTGDICDTSIDECESGPCHNDATCIDGVNSYICICPLGWTGLTCQQNVNECSSSPCTNGICSDGVAGFKCVCAPGWTGTACDTDVDECQSDPCQNGGNCTDKVDGFECSCVADWMGDMCQTRPSGGCFECKMSFNISDCYRTGQWKECQSEDAVCAIHVHRNVNGEVSQFKRKCGERVSCERSNRTDEDSSEGTHVSEENEEEQEDEPEETAEEGEKEGGPKEKKKTKEGKKKSTEDKKKPKEDKKGKSTRGRRSRPDKSDKSRGSDPKSSRESGSSASEDTESEEDSDSLISSSSEERSSSNEENSGSRSEEADNTTTMVTPGARRQQKGENVVYHTCEETVHDNSLDDCASDPCPSTATCVDTGPSYVCV